MRDQVAIVGIGCTEFSKDSGVSTLTLAARAILAAVEDAGVQASELDGIATFRVGDSVPPAILAQSLGIRDLRYFVDQFGGGSVSHSIVGQAALAIHAGIAETVVCYRALNARSEFRMGGTGRPPVDAIETQYQAPFGYFTPPQQFAMAARAHMERYGTSAEQLGAVAVQQRANASLNERAMMRKPISLDDYLASRWIVEPFRLLDCCLETDGAVALLLTSAERARDLRQDPILISGVTWGSGQTLYSNQQPDSTRTSAADMAPRLFEMAGVGPHDIDVAELYDCFSYSVLVQLEDYGFCKKGEGGAFVESGATALGGSLPVNTHGGFLSEGYVHGLNHVYEAVSQLRGDAGERQVENAQVALSAAQPGYVSGNTSALVLRRDS
ncbi:MAG: acetyl-CoA acetyltransferase [Deltaproteobacteria bacterium]|nr:acetyl-CoA acetyltransferase [Deltaproteobacteria bacterium]MBW2359971.1 acetyl-CoA acetyltransferase [Deltaproteobacteria bacterium]